MIAYLFQDPQNTEGAKNYVENPAPPAPLDDFGQLERLASTFGHVDGLFYFTYVVCIFFFVLITAVLGYSVIKYRRKTYDQPAVSNVTHNTPLEVVWTVIPLIIVMVMFAWGWKGSLDMTVVPADARQYKAVAKQWNWTFYYPNDPVPSYNELWLEIGKPAAFTVESTDVLHAFFIPSMRVKRDVVPGRLGTIWFEPTELGEFHLFCAEYCGQDHSKMYAKVHVVSADKYAERPWDEWDPNDMVGNGEKLYKQLCASCHMVNGAAMTGPPWNNLYTKNAAGEIVGTEREVILPDGSKTTVTVDDAYIVESIRMPDAKKVADPLYVNNNMTAFPDLADDRIQAIIEYMQSLAQ